MSISDLLKHITCPITNKIFLSPIITSNGKIYEELAYIEKTEDENFNYIKIHQLASFIDMILEFKPSLKKQRFKIDYKKSKQLFMVNKNKVIFAIKNKNYDIILNYKDFLIKIIGKNLYIRVLKHAEPQIAKHLINNTKDINGKLEHNDGWSLINIIVSKESSKIVKMLFECDAVDFNSRCGGDGWTAGHQLIHYNQHNDDIRLEILKKGRIDLTLINEDGMSVTHFCFRWGSDKIIDYILQKIDKYSAEDISRIISYLETNNKIDPDKKEKYIDIIIQRCNYN